MNMLAVLPVLLLRKRERLAGAGPALHSRLPQVKNMIEPVFLRIRDDCCVDFKSGALKVFYSDDVRVKGTTLIHMYCSPFQF